MSAGNLSPGISCIFFNYILQRFQVMIAHTRWFINHPVFLYYSRIMGLLRTANHFLCPVKIYLVTSQVKTAILEFSKIVPRVTVKSFLQVWMNNNSFFRLLIYKILSRYNAGKTVHFSGAFFYVLTANFFI
jgi:hypothetical protein